MPCFEKAVDMLDTKTKVKAVDDFRIVRDAPKTITLKAEDFGGEYRRKNYVYVLILWLVSIWAMITNLVQAICIKLFRRQRTSFKKILWEMGRNPEHISSLFVDRFSRFNHQAKVDAASWRSLELFYNYQEKIRPQLDNNAEGVFTRFWMEMENRQAVANRLKIVANLLVDVFHKFADEPEIRLISLASGSAQAVIEAMQRCSHLHIRALMIDIDKTAIKELEKKAREAGLEDRFTSIRGTISSTLEKMCRKFRPHIVEMIGFLDYCSRKKAIQLIRRIRCCLPEGGYFLTCNIRDNREKIFLNWVLLWPMIYRSEEQFTDLLVEGGFQLPQINLFCEPFKIHMIGVCKK